MEGDDERLARARDVLATLGGGADAARGLEAYFDAQGAVGDYALRFGAGEVWSRPSLARRDRSLVVIALLTALGRERELRAHVAGGLHHGLAREEIDEILLQTAVYAGVPFALGAVAVANEVFAARDGAPQRRDAPARLAPADGATRRAAGADVLRTLLAQRERDMPAVLDATLAALGEMGRCVVDTAFGEVWSRPGLSRRDRSLVVVAVLTALSQPRELETHVRGALHHGVTQAELEELMLTAVVYAGFPRAIEGLHAARRAIGEASPAPPR